MRRQRAGHLNNRRWSCIPLECAFLKSAEKGARGTSASTGWPPGVTLEREDTGGKRQMQLVEVVLVVERQDYFSRTRIANLQLALEGLEAGRHVTGVQEHSLFVIRWLVAGLAGPALRTMMEFGRYTNRLAVGRASYRELEDASLAAPVWNFSDPLNASVQLRDVQGHQIDYE